MWLLVIRSPEPTSALSFAEMKRTRDDFSSDEEEAMVRYFDDDDELEQAMVRILDREEQMGGPLVEDYFDEDDDAWEHAMVRALDREEQLGGALGPLFDFRMVPTGRRRRWRETTDHSQFHAHLEQQRDATDGDNLGIHLTEALYRAIRTQIASHARLHDLLHFAIQAHGFAHAFRSSNIRVEEFMNRGTYLDELLDTLAGKLNSNEEFHPDRGFQVDVVVVRMPTPGSGRGRKRNVGLRAMEEDSKRKNSIISIKNKDTLCCARAIVTMKAHCHRNDPGCMPRSNWNALRDGRRRQETMARQLHRDAGVPEGPCGLPELEKFQQFLAPHYQIKVVSRMKPFFVIFRGPEAPHIIYLLKSNQHYEGCTTMTGFTNRSYWCDLCDRGFDHNDGENHPCEGRTCRACQRTSDHPCPDYDKFQKPHLPCPRCHFKFYGQDCLHHHQASDRCKKYEKCLDCHAGFKVDKKHPHVCGQEECYSCGHMVMIADHKCYIQSPYQPPPPKQRNKDGESENETPPPKMVYADIECMLTEERGFIPNLLCYRMQDQADFTTHRGEDCVEVFLRDLNELSHPPREDIEEQPLIIMFHNLKGFDGIFILNELYKDMRTVEEQLTVGAKVLSFKSGPLVFKDSLCFLPMPLSSFPATFDFTERKKGFFPHSFNLPINQDYVGPIPPIHYFDPDGMSPKMKTELERWHAEQVLEQERSGVQYDFQKELEDYCRSDVDILQSGCEAFCEEFEKYAGFNPFAECFTIASACNTYWRKTHLVPDTIAVEPPQGWRGARVNQSAVALQWLHYQQSLPNVTRIQHVRNGGEKKLWLEKGPVYVDGFDAETNTVYEFMGCLWHGCPTCCKHQRSRRYGANPDRTLEELYEATLDKINRLQRAGHTVVVEWECQWEKKVKSTPAIQTFLSTLNMVPPLQPREAFFGGRTGAVALYHRVGPGEKIYYVDVTSLYPWVNKTQPYPLGHPEIECPPTSQDIGDYFGLATVTILPPRGLYHPVLPVRHGGKLTFPLCMACVREQQAEPMLERSALCTHSDQQRQLRGTWCTPEIEKAKEMGYELLHIHEVWHFPRQEAGLFQPYVDTWLKLKQESAGWPRWCETQEQKARYVRQYQEREGITLNVKENKGRKQVAKLMLNSFWGKFGEKTNKSKVEQVVQPHQLYKILTDSANDLQTLRLCTDDVLEVVYKQSEDNDLPSDRTNIFIAAFTTCWARLKLYSYLERLGEQVLYYDTDSVIYRWKSGQCEIETGDFLGEMTDELDGDHIIEFVSGGAKNYGYQTSGGKFECKVRGFTLNVRGRQVLNYQTMKENLLAELDDPAGRTIAVKNPNHFKRDSTLKKIKLVEQVKNYRLVFDKRVVDRRTKRSYPFGYF